MSDIFISYKREEQATARELADALEKEGWTVWWDPKLRAGERFDDVIEKALNEAKCVIVLWSNRSVNSEYVKAEATEALEQNKLVPIKIESVSLPFRFKRVQTPSLLYWDGSRDFSEFRKLVQDIATIAGLPATEAKRKADEAPERNRLEQAAEQRRLEAEKRRKAEEERLREGERQRIEEETRRKSREENHNQKASESGLTWFQQCRAIIGRLYGPTIASAAVAVLIASIVVFRWRPLQPNKEPVTKAASTGEELEKTITAPRTADAKQEKQGGTQSPLSVGRVFRDQLKSGSEGPEMIVVPIGSFRMGNIQGRGDRDEVPVHTVTIQKPFAIGRYELAFSEYDDFAKATNRRLPSDEGWGRGGRPVINVSWQDAVEYANWLSVQTGKRYRLPSEAEWEYAARGGKESKYWWGNDFLEGMANCNGCGSQWDNKQTAPVGSFKNNPFRLYDTSGNVWEGVEDCNHQNYIEAPMDGRPWLENSMGQCRQRVLRGGSWNEPPEGLRSSNRYADDVETRASGVGFRVVRDID